VPVVHAARSGLFPLVLMLLLEEVQDWDEAAEAGAATAASTAAQVMSPLSHAPSTPAVSPQILSPLNKALGLLRHLQTALGASYRGGCSLLQLAAWCGQLATVAILLHHPSETREALEVGAAEQRGDTLLETTQRLKARVGDALAWGESREDRWLPARLAEETMAVFGRSSTLAASLTLLDIALLAGHTLTARYLVRHDVPASHTLGARTQALLHRFILLGDATAVRALLMLHRGAVQVDRAVLSFTNALPDLDRCTFVGTQFSHPIPQFMGVCSRCTRKVCLCCVDYCHEFHPAPSGAPPPRAPEGRFKCVRHTIGSFEWVPRGVCECHGAHLPSPCMLGDDAAVQQCKRQGAEERMLWVPEPLCLTAGTLGVLGELQGDNAFYAWPALREDPVRGRRREARRRRASDASHERLAAPVLWPLPPPERCSPEDQPPAPGAEPQRRRDREASRSGGRQRRRGFRSGSASVRPALATNSGRGSISTYTGVDSIRSIRHDGSKAVSAERTFALANRGPAKPALAAVPAAPPLLLALGSSHESEESPRFASGNETRSASAVAPAAAVSSPVAASPGPTSQPLLEAGVGKSRKPAPMHALVLGDASGSVHHVGSVVPVEDGDSDEGAIDDDSSDGLDISDTSDDSDATLSGAEGGRSGVARSGSSSGTGSGTASAASSRAVSPAGEASPRAVGLMEGDTDRVSFDGLTARSVADVTLDEVGSLASTAGGTAAVPSNGETSLRRRLSGAPPAPAHQSVPKPPERPRRWQDVAGDADVQRTLQHNLAQVYHVEWCRLTASQGWHWAASTNFSAFHNANLKPWEQLTPAVQCENLLFAQGILQFLHQRGRAFGFEFHPQGVRPPLAGSSRGSATVAPTVSAEAVKSAVAASAEPPVRRASGTGSHSPAAQGPRVQRSSFTIGGEAPPRARSPVSATRPIGIGADLPSAAPLLLLSDSSHSDSSSGEHGAAPTPLMDTPLPSQALALRSALSHRSIDGEGPSRPSASQTAATVRFAAGIDDGHTASRTLRSLLAAAPRPSPFDDAPLRAPAGVRSATAAPGQVPVHFQHYARLVQEMATWHHEAYCLARMVKGFRWAREHNPANAANSWLVPYDHLVSARKRLYEPSARAVIARLVREGWLTYTGELRGTGQGRANQRLRTAPTFVAAPGEPLVVAAEAAGADGPGAGSQHVRSRKVQAYRMQLTVFFENAAALSRDEASGVELLQLLQSGDAEAGQGSLRQDTAKKLGRAPGGPEEAETEGQPAGGGVRKTAALVALKQSAFLGRERIVRHLTTAESGKELLLLPDEHGLLAKEYAAFGGHTSILRLLEQSTDAEAEKRALGAEAWPRIFSDTPETLRRQAMRRHTRVVNREHLRGRLQEQAGEDFSPVLDVGRVSLQYCLFAAGDRAPTSHDSEKQPLAAPRAIMPAIDTLTVAVLGRQPASVADLVSLHTHETTTPDGTGVSPYFRALLLHGLAHQVRLELRRRRQKGQNPLGGRHNSTVRPHQGWVVWISDYFSYRFRALQSRREDFVSTAAVEVARELLAVLHRVEGRELNRLVAAAHMAEDAEAGAATAYPVTAAGAHGTATTPAPPATVFRKATARILGRGLPRSGASPATLGVGGVSSPSPSVTASPALGPQRSSPVLGGTQNPHSRDPTAVELSSAFGAGSSAAARMPRAVSVARYASVRRIADGPSADGAKVRRLSAVANLASIYGPSGTPGPMLTAATGNTIGGAGLGGATSVGELGSGPKEAWSVFVLTEAEQLAGDEEDTTARVLDGFKSSSHVERTRIWWAINSLWWPLGYMVMVAMWLLVSPSAPNLLYADEAALSLDLAAAFNGFASSVTNVAPWFAFVDKNINFIPDYNVSSNSAMAFTGSYVDGTDAPWDPAASRRLQGGAAAAALAAGVEEEWSGVGREQEVDKYPEDAMPRLRAGPARVPFRLAMSAELEYAASALLTAGLGSEAAPRDQRTARQQHQAAPRAMQSLPAGDNAPVFFDSTGSPVLVHAAAVTAIANGDPATQTTVFSLLNTTSGSVTAGQVYADTPVGGGGALPASATDGQMIIGQCMVLGAVRLRAIQGTPGKSCPTWAGLPLTLSPMDPCVNRAGEVSPSLDYGRRSDQAVLPQRDLTGNIDGGTVIDLNSADLEARRAQTDAIRPPDMNPLPTAAAAAAGRAPGFVTQSTRSLVIDLTLYVPSIAALACVRLYSYVTVAGPNVNEVVVRTMRSPHAAYAPPGAFIALTALQALYHIALCVMHLRPTALTEARAAAWSCLRCRWPRASICGRKRGGLKTARGLPAGLTLDRGGLVSAFVEFLYAALLVSVLALECKLLYQLDQLHLSLAAPATFFDVWAAMDTWASVRDLTAVIVFVATMRFLRVLGVLPYVGPVLTALRRTIASANVLLNTFIIIGICFIVSVSHTIAFGPETFNFSILRQSFLSLFTVTFGSDVSSYVGIFPRATSSVFYLCWLILAGLLFNLLIAVVQNAFDIMVRSSAVDWQDTLTRMMEESLLQRMQGEVLATRERAGEGASSPGGGDGGSGSVDGGAGGGDPGVHARPLTDAERLAKELKELEERMRASDPPEARRAKLTEYLRALMDEQVRRLTQADYERHRDRVYAIIAEEAADSEAGDSGGTGALLSARRRACCCAEHGVCCALWRWLAPRRGRLAPCCRKKPQPKKIKDFERPEVLWGRLRSELLTWGVFATGQAAVVGAPPAVAAAAAGSTTVEKGAGVALAKGHQHGR
jgi:hypothetical protein